MRGSVGAGFVFFECAIFRRGVFESVVLWRRFKFSVGFAGAVSGAEFFETGCRSG